MKADIEELNSAGVSFGLNPKTKLSFGKGNKKVDKDCYTFSIPAGHACPFAEKCFLKADRVTGELIGRSTSEDRFPCYAARTEFFRPSVRVSRWHNWELIRACHSKEQIVELLDKSLSKKATRVRVHVGGDFYSSTYLAAWLSFAQSRPQTRFYAYTKAIGFWLALRAQIPPNFKLIASYGGKFDFLIAPNGLRYVKVVNSQAEADALGLKVSPPDSDAIAEFGTESFALIKH